MDDGRKWLRRVSLAAGIAFTATAEYDLARELGANPVIAAMLPVAVDAYVMAALRWFRAFDVTLSLALMGAAQVAAHLLDARVMTVNIPMVIVVSLLVPVAIWRTHALARTEDEEGLRIVSTPAEPPAETPEPARVSVSVERVPELPRMVIVEPFKMAAGTRGGTGVDLDVPEWVKRPELEAEPAEPDVGSGDVADVPAGVSAEHVVTVRTWLAVEPELTGTEIGTRLGKSDSYGRRVKRYIGSAPAVT